MVLSMKMCPKCSAACQDNDVICQNCGYLFSPEGEGAPQAPQSAYANGPEPEKYTGNDGFAVAALVLGIISVVGDCCYGLGLLLGIPALVFGILSLVRAKKRGTGINGMAIAGVVLGGVSIILGALFLLSIYLNRGEIANYVRQYLQIMKENGYGTSST